MSNVFNETKTLENGVAMPQLGLGVYKMTEPEKAFESIAYAIKTGYRAIDTAAIYQNEKETGDAVRHSSVPREELFITSKVGIRIRDTMRHCVHSNPHSKSLVSDYLDLYLTHWPVEG